jgi:hypothetical protein
MLKMSLYVRYLYPVLPGLSGSVVKQAFPLINR